MTDPTTINPFAEGVKLTATVMLILGTLGFGVHVVEKKTRLPCSRTLWNVFLCVVVLFVIGAWMWSVAVAGRL